MSSAASRSSASVPGDSSWRSNRLESSAGSTSRSDTIRLGARSIFAEYVTIEMEPGWLNPPIMIVEFNGKDVHFNFEHKAGQALFYREAEVLRLAPLSGTWRMVTLRSGDTVRLPFPSEEDAVNWTNGLTGYERIHATKFGYQSWFTLSPREKQRWIDNPSRDW